MKNFIQSFISFDLFGVAPTLSYKGVSKSKSLFGSLSSYLMLCYMCLAMLYSFQGMVLRNNPNTITSKQEGRVQGVPYGGKDQFNIGISIISPLTTRVNDPSIFTFETQKFQLQYHQENGTISGVTTTKIPLEECDQVHFHNQFNFSGSCVAQNQSMTIGTLNREPYTIRMNRCDNATSPIPCKPTSVIDQIYNTHVIYATFPVYYLTPENYKEPYSIKEVSEVTKLSSGLSKVMLIQLVEYEIQTDVGFLLSDIEVTSFLMVDSVKTDVNDDGANSFNVRIQMKGEKIIMKRSYPKIQQALAGTIALTRVGFVLCVFLVVPCTRISYYKVMLDELFTWSGSKNQNLSNKNPEFFFKKLREENEKSRQSMSINSGTSNEAISQSLKPPDGRSSVGNHFMQKVIMTNMKKQYQEGINNNESQAIDESRQDSVNSEIGEDIRMQGNVKKIEEEDQQYNDSQPLDHNTVKIDLKSSSDAPANLILNTEENPLNKYQQRDLGQNNLKLSSKDSQNSKSSYSQKSIPSSFMIWLREKVPCIQTKESKMFQKGEKEIKRSLCITTVIKQLREIERLKQVLFDKDQST